VLFYNKNFLPNELLVHHIRGLRIKILHLKVEILTGFCGLSQSRKQESANTFDLENQELHVSAPTLLSAGCRMIILEIINNNASTIISILSNKNMLCPTTRYLYTEHNGVSRYHSLFIQAHTSTVAHNHFPPYWNHKPIKSD